jgi:hypothetical protein
MKRNCLKIITILLISILAASCANRGAVSSHVKGSSALSSLSNLQNSSSLVSSEVYSSESVSSQAEVQSSQTPAEPSWPTSGGVPSPVNVPNLDGQNVVQNDSAIIDLSYISYGFLKARLKTASASKMKMMISCNGTTYYYDLKNDCSVETFPLQFGNGSYTISIMINSSGSQYSYLLTTTAQVTYLSTNISFLVPSQQVNYSSGSNASKLAQQLVSGKSNNYERISTVLTYVAQNITYDYALAANPPIGYIPIPDAVLARKKGICYDYAAVSAAMLRSLGYPTKLITGYVDNGATYHAWNEVYLDGQGWLKVMSVKVSTSAWSRIDVTFISNSKSPSDIEKYIGNSSNYVNRYIY